MKTNSGRRDFLKTAGMGAVALAAGTQVTSAAERQKVTLGIIGPGGMGMHHIRQLSERSDVHIAYVCDVDSRRLGVAVDHVSSATGKAPKGVGDFRHILDDRTVDAVWIATPDHWHGPAAILALDAGKHVYVEKPCCHNIREGRLMAEAVARSGKFLQVGTQSRSGDAIQEAIQRLREGEIGDILVAKAWNSQRRGSIGRSQPSPPPDHLDFDMWVGPAPLVPYRSNLLHAVWRWWYDFGCGDIGNDGVHDIDVALWGLGVNTDPERVICSGGKNCFDDDQQFPDTQYAVCDYPADGSPARPKQLVYEQRIWSPYTQEGYENGAAFYGTDGYMILGHTRGWRMYQKNKLIAERKGGADLVAHHSNFLDCVRGDAKQTNADIDVGVRAATVAHLANIAARTRTALEFDSSSGQITNSKLAAALVGRTYRENHWADPTATH